MKRKSRFFVGLFAAALTFGTLMATVGHGHYKNNHHGCMNSCSKSEQQQDATTHPNNDTKEKFQ